MKQLLYLLLLIFLASCTEHSGINLNIEKDEPYYDEHEPNLLWKTRVDSFEERQQGFLSKAVALDGSIYTLTSSYTDVLYSINQEDGSVQWKTKLPQPDNLHSIFSFQIYKNGNDVYMINDRNAQVYHISQSDGQLYNTRSPEELGVQIYPLTPPTLIKDQLYFLRIEEGGVYSMVKYDIIEHSYETIFVFQDINRISESSLFHFNEEQNQLIFAFQYQNQLQERRHGLFSIDLNNHGLQTVWEQESGIFFDVLLTSTERLAIFRVNSDTLLAVNLETGTIQWAYTLPELGRLNHIYISESEVVLHSTRQFLSLDVETGSLNWSSNEPSIYSPPLNIPINKLLIGFKSFRGPVGMGVTIFDLHDGQKLTQWPLSDYGDPVYGLETRFIIYDDNTEEVYVGTQQDIYKFNQLLP